MIWHICKKDFRLLWPWALLLAALQGAWHIFEAKHLPSGSPSFASSQLYLKSGPLIATVAVIVFVIQQDGLPGLALDWLVRPIRRSHLFLAKILFCAFVVLLPMVVFDIVEGLMTGFTLSQILTAALSHALFLALCVILPLFAVAATTKGIADFTAMALLLFLLVEMPRSLLADYFTLRPTVWSGASWIPTTAGYGIVLAGSLLVLWLQYSARRTTWSRILLPLFAVGGFMTDYTPWPVLMSVQSRLSPDIEASRSVAIEFDPTQPPWHESPGPFRRKSVSIPIKVSGVPPNAHLFADFVEITVFDSDGKPVYDHGRTGVSGQGSPSSYLYSDRPVGAYVGLPLWFLIDPAKPLPGQPIRVLIDFALTLAEPEGDDATFGPTDIRIALPKQGLCKTRLEGEFGTPPIDFDCLHAGSATDWSLVSAYDGDESKPYAQSLISFSYAPSFARLLRDPIDRTDSFINPLKMRPTAQLYQNTRFTLRNFRSIAHFRYRLEIPAIRLEDWGTVIDPELKE